MKKNCTATTSIPSMILSAKKPHQGPRVNLHN